MKPNPDPILDRVYLASGGRRALARHLGIRMESTFSWLRVPPARALAIEKLTGIPVYELRPDIFPQPSKDAA
ncbi:MAG: YdaS family helix-turn-helix protein [Acetobacteraceae bacterium]